MLHDVVVCVNLYLHLWYDCVSLTKERYYFHEPSRNGSCLLWDLSSPSPTLTTTMHQAHSSNITDISFSPTNPVLIASCSNDRTVAFHDIDSNRTVQVLSPSYPKDKTSIGGLTTLAFRADGLTLAVGLDCGLVYLYDLRHTSNGPIFMMDAWGDGVDDGIGSLVKRV